jgi:hypothetical protein
MFWLRKSDGFIVAVVVIICIIICRIGGMGNTIVIFKLAPKTFSFLKCTMNLDDRHMNDLCLSSCRDHEAIFYYGDYKNVRYQCYHIHPYVTHVLNQKRIFYTKQYIKTNI